MNTRKKLLGLGIAAIVGLSMAVPSMAGAQSYRYRHDVSRENSDRNNALLLGAAGLLLGANHQSTLGTIALGGAAYEAYRLQQDIQSRHNQYGYYDNRGYGYSYNNGYGYGYGRSNGYAYGRNHEGDRDDVRRDRDDRDRGSYRTSRDRDHDGDRR